MKGLLITHLYGNLFYAMDGECATITLRVPGFCGHLSCYGLVLVSGDN